MNGPQRDQLMLLLYHGRLQCGRGISRRVRADETNKIPEGRAHGINTRHKEENKKEEELRDRNQNQKPKRG